MDDGRLGKEAGVVGGMETEVKFYVKDLRRVESRLRGLEARVIQERVFERNIRFDWPDASLRAEGRVLRLRQDTEARLTYKGPSTHEDGVMSRREIEFTVGDFEAARELVEALGYRKLVVYEKYRTVYEFGETHVMLDELPIGLFVEIEAGDTGALRDAAARLGLRWESAIGTSYTALFDRAREGLKLDAGDLRFVLFEGVRVSNEDLDVREADVEGD